MIRCRINVYLSYLEWRRSILRKILRGLVVLFLLFFVSPSFVRADETSETTGGSTETPQQVLEIAPRAISGGSGKANDPYLVSTITDLKSALGQSIPSGETALYIKLTGDILYSYSDRTISINKNTVLDGDGHYILYSGTNYDGDHFITEI